MLKMVEMQGYGYFPYCVGLQLVQFSSEAKIVSCIESFLVQVLASLQCACVCVCVCVRVLFVCNRKCVRLRGKRKRKDGKSIKEPYVCKYHECSAVYVQIHGHLSCFTQKEGWC